MEVRERSEVEELRVLVFLGCGPDPAIRPPLDPRSGRVRGDWLVWEVDPASAAALALALGLKKSGRGVHLTALHLGSPAGEIWLRRALARGCDRAVRIAPEEEKWTADEADAAGCRGLVAGPGWTARLGVAGKAVILAAAAAVCGFDLILLGGRGTVSGSGQLGLRLAAELGVPCVTGVRSLSLRSSSAAQEDLEQRRGPAERPGFELDRVLLVRIVEEGFTERLEAEWPLVVTVAPPADRAVGEGGALSAGALLWAQSADIPVWSLADLGIPAERIRRADELLTCGPSRLRRPRLIPVPAPPQDLPAFERVLRLVEGSVRRREGRVLRLPVEEVAGEVFRVLCEEGWLDHLRPEGEGQSSGSLPRLEVPDTRA